MAFAMVAAFSLAFVSCSSDDDDDDFSIGGNKIEINGTEYSIFDAQWMGVWLDLSDPKYNTMMFEIPVMAVKRVESHTFNCQTPTMPKTGDDLASVGVFTLSISNVADKNAEGDYAYKSGTAKITSMNKSEDEITVQFNNLKMQKGSYSYTYNGIVVIPFNFDTVN